MWFLRATAFAACLTAVTTFRDTSPYLLFSTSEPPNLDEASSRQVQSAADVLRITKDFLSGCPSDIYVIISQPNLNIADFSSTTALPRLQRFVSRDNVKTKIRVSEVIGELSARDLEEYLESYCGATVIEVDQFSAKVPISDVYSRPFVVRQSFTPLPGTRSEREVVLGNNDVLLQMLLNKTVMGKEYTVMYTSTYASSEIDPESKPYEPVFVEPLHIELKRQPDSNVVDSNIVPDNAPLFERYQFFTPGLFMGLLVAVLLLSILGVAISAVSSLEVSYGAFDKEMGPAVQKK